MRDEPLVVNAAGFCPHGVNTLVYRCVKCIEQARRERTEARHIEVYERLIGTLDALREFLAEASSPATKESS